MVFLTNTLMKYMPHWWRRSERRSVFFKRVSLFRLTGCFGGVSRNCFRVAINKWTKTMQYKPKYRRMRTQMLQDLYSQRILGAVEEHGLRYELFHSSLTKCGIELNRKSLANLAIYEPKTFASLVDLAKTKFAENGGGEEAIYAKPVNGVITRGML
ncbi:50S ribosomal protein L20-like [Oppia nitens]|uniref:50S ribosomal protein L20-like n=1 Tax=Oppia nitens TaxID=1686743 RepID=UPI0023DA67EE|nr:50S ribosomal protein L20-like [Oppia nitens]